MTATNRTTIKAFFQTGDKPSESNFSDFIDSCAFLAETSAQVFSGSIGVSATVSALRGEFTTVSAGTLNVATFNATNVNVTTVSAATVNATNVNATNVNAAVSASNLSSSGTTSLKGTTTNDNAAAGYIGQLIESEVLQGSAVTLTSTASKNVTFIPLSGGDYDVWGNVFFLGNAATTTTSYLAAINSVTDALPTFPGKGGLGGLSGQFPAGFTGQCLNAGTLRVQVTTSANIYLVAQCTFAVNSMSAFGYIGARRRR